MLKKISILFVQILFPILTFSLNCSQKLNENRNIYFWIANPDNLINKKTNSCSIEFLNNFSKYQDVIDGFGPYLWKSQVINFSYIDAVPEYNSAIKCYQEIKSKYPKFRLAASAGIDECWNNNCNAKVIGRNYKQFINSILNFKENFSKNQVKIDDIWIDFETKNLNSDDTKNLNAFFNTLSHSLPTNSYLYRYAGCVHNHEPAYLNETCQQFTEKAPDVIVQGAGTYWDNTPNGFKSVFLDMLSDIGMKNNKRLSVAVCPDCRHYDQITQNELYDRMDLLCNYNITSISGFTLDEILQLYGVNNTGGRWMKAFKYFKYGVK